MLPTFFTKNSQALYTFLLRINIPKSSEFSTMAQTKFMFFSLLVLVLVITLPLSCVKAQQASSVFSSYHLYNPDQIGWDLYAVAAYCSTYYGDMPLEWRQKYGWTAFCGPSGPSIDSACGQCLKVTNTDTGDETIVRIIDQCNNGGMDLDVAMFNQIDSNGQGYAQGHLIVDYEFVDCGDF